MESPDLQEWTRIGTLNRVLRNSLEINETFVRFMGRHFLFELGWVASLYLGYL